jgi:hypothetical protein
LGEHLSTEDSIAFFTKYIEDLNVQDHLTINTSTSMVSRTSIKHTKEGSFMMVRDPVYYRTKEILGVAHHEVGTHFLRKFNERLQGANAKKFERDFATEEGFACCNQLI